MKCKKNFQLLDTKLMIGLSIVLENDEKYQKFHEHLEYNKFLFKMKSKTKNFKNYNDKILYGLNYTLKVDRNLQELRSLVKIAMLSKELEEMRL